MEDQRLEEIVWKLMNGPVRDATGFKGPCGCTEHYCGYCRIREGAIAAIREVLASQEEELRSLREERDEARAIVADVNNSVIGSQGYFTKPSCVDAIEEVKFAHNRACRRAESAEQELRELREEMRHAAMERNLAE